MVVSSRIPPRIDPATPGASPSRTVPAVLQLGSGKRFQPDWLNLDIDASWRPDVVADLNRPFPGEDCWFSTERFGRIELRPGSFDRIVAHDVLEHVRELTTCMQSCLNLLAEGGVFEISVPYDLSYGAWQDPTHVRGFNERSWVYYGDWCWYLGWDAWHLRTERLDLQLSPIGQQLVADGGGQDVVLRTPRAVDSMSVELVKQRVPAAVRAAGAAHRAIPGH